MPEKWGCGGEWSHFSTSYPGRSLLRAGLPQVGLQGRAGGQLFFMSCFKTRNHLPRDCHI